MKSLKSFIIFLIAVVFVCILITMNAKAADGEKVFTAKCVSCHSLELALKKQYDQKKWASTIDRMKGFGLKITGNEASAVAEFLASKEKK
ncbi:c-type cytochrome [Geovibrio thiophilus]|uniref:C-type cytochrome n=1 Tax=Geovibrio thiophilus TaxID=139438 RepID=A0A410JXE4_9BACT|nr:c-type cytochrome [Geovibrio thiophilus]QAR32852.1 c-type cytochrome [Geovibrio thiophilus]